MEEEAEHEFRGMGGRSWSYKERDVPANQLFQNLERKIGEREKRWGSMNFEEKVQLELEISDYLRNALLMFRQLGIRLPNFQRPDTVQLENFYQRGLIQGSIADTETQIQRLEWGKQSAQMLWEAYDYLINNDRRVSPVTREELLASSRPKVRSEVMKMIQDSGGIDGPKTGYYLVDKTQELGQPIEALVKVDTKDGRYNTALVRVDRDALVGFIRNYFALEVIFKALHARLKIEQRDLSDLQAELRQYGGSLTPDEKQRMARFMQGREPGRSTGTYLSYLDYIRFVGEMALRHEPKSK
ncbi:hypothetical protein HYX05_01145 [Candidatus Woesearchaeota archaeon]|nr:hypothetical protein [Candidatus Woesearchaeota archaeon]